eukprot:TRINITY_DN25521_c0_g1_i1.p1 TRINITY_DN25521_c0_g1~~TRINITY_DN25521_c0_g1_i1.p1  ORF type:complete len:931 (-),score=236.53 TRINITY_DN25521_c0_g1_i1:16-2808(-)
MPGARAGGVSSAATAARFGASHRSEATIVDEKEMAELQEIFEGLAGVSEPGAIFDFTQCSPTAQNQKVQKWECFHRIKNYPAVILMNNGQFEELTLRDVQDLFNALDQDASGFLDFAEVKLLLQQVVHPPITDEQVEMIYELTDKRIDGKVSADELFRALTEGAVKQHLRRMQTNNRIQAMLADLTGESAVISRDLMIDRINFSVERDDAFRTLPVTMFYLGVFIALVILHLNIMERQEVERGVEEWVMGFAEPLGPNLVQVADAESMWGWLHDTGLPSLFGSCSISAAGAAQCVVGPRLLLVGDASVSVDGGDRNWLLASDLAVAHLATSPGDYLGAARKELQRIRATAPVAPVAQEVSINAVTYCDQAGMFAVMNVGTKMKHTGFVVPSMNSNAIPIDPYASTGFVQMIIVDSCYCLFILYMCGNELLSVFSMILQNGFLDAMRLYWNFWNLVDWLNIGMGITSVVIWLLATLAMYAEGVHGILVEENGVMRMPETMSLDVTTLDVIEGELATVIDYFRLLHIVMGLNTVSIMLKFFKAFQANPRLALVTNTLKRAAVDILHFGIVFLTVFIAFAVIGHILFGGDIVQFSSVQVSINTAFVVLMGEFGWYAENGPEAPAGLSSGMPRLVIILWFWLYMIFVLLILLNMLLAIILEHYTELVMQVKQEGAETLLQQTREFIAERRRTKNHLKLGDVLLALQDDDAGVHAEEQVTLESLLHAFPDMPTDQAAHLIVWFQREARKRTGPNEDELLGRLRIMEKSMTSLTEDVQAVKLNVAVCTSKLRGEQRVDATGGDQEFTNIDLRGQEKLNVAAKLEYLSMQVAQLSQDVRILDPAPKELQDLPLLVTQLAGVAERAAQTLRSVTAVAPLAAGAAAGGAPGIGAAAVGSVVSSCWRQQPGVMRDVLPMGEAYTSPPDDTSNAFYKSLST